MATAVIVHPVYSRETRDTKDSKIPLEEIVLDNVGEFLRNGMIHTIPASGKAFELGVETLRMRCDCPPAGYPVSQDYDGVELNQIRPIPMALISTIGRILMHFHVIASRILLIKVAVEPW